MTLCFQLSLLFCYDILQGFDTEHHEKKITLLHKQTHMFRGKELSAFALINQSEERLLSVKLQMG